MIGPVSAAPSVEAASKKGNTASACKIESERFRCVSQIGAALAERGSAQGVGLDYSKDDRPSGKAGDDQLVQPDNFVEATDVGDDALSINRLIMLECAKSTGRKDIVFQARHYQINSPIRQTCELGWHGHGFQEQPRNLKTASGTWFDIGRNFLNSHEYPINFSGNTQGSVIEDIAFDEPDMTPAPAKNNSKTSKSDQSATTWTPTNYPQIIEVLGSTGLEIRHTLWDGVNAAIAIKNSGRTNIYDIRGQAFAYLINTQDSLDVTRIVDLHEWPFWSDSDPVVQFQQKNSSAIISFRNDSPFWSRIFAFGVLNGILINGSAQGTTTGVQVDAIQCDFTAHCIHVSGNAENVQMQIGALRSYSQSWNTSIGAPVNMIRGSSAVKIDGQAILQIGMVDDFGDDISTFEFTNNKLASNIYIGSVLRTNAHMSMHSSLIAFPPLPTVPSTVSITNLMQTSGPSISNPLTGPTANGTLWLDKPDLGH